MLASENHSIYSSYSKEEFLPSASGSHRVHYQPHSDWDFHLDTARKDIDLALVLPHYRARTQPVDHRMSMFVGSESGGVKVKICRPLQRQRFALEVQASTSDVTVYLPSDFRGTIVHSGGKTGASFSAGFVNRIMPHARIHQRSPSHQPNHTSPYATSPSSSERTLVSHPASGFAHAHKRSHGYVDEQEDLVVVGTLGRITLRMWDVETGRAECVQKEALKRIFGCCRRGPEHAPEGAVDWDFLLEDQ